MVHIKYEIDIHTYWHCGSGLAAGADVDALVIKDDEGVPYIPGKTIKGLVREAVDELLEYGNYENIKENDYQMVFGYLDDNNDEDKKNVKMKKSESFFGNATIKDYNDIICNKLQKHLFDSVANTAIDDKGIAKKHSLRKIQVTIPTMMEGKILDVPESMKEVVKDALSFIKCLGMERNRGLGRCTIKIVED